MRRSLALVFVVVLQTAALIAMIAMKQWTLATGTLIELETVPIDPRSLFRGDYVRLGYAIGQLNEDALDGDNGFARLDTIYVVLREGEVYWQPVSLHKERPPAPPDGVAVRGHVEYAYKHHETKANTLRVRYGIENYFVPEGEGRALEQPKEDETISIQVSVDSYGNAGIKAVLVNGEGRYVEKLW